MLHKNQAEEYGPFYCDPQRVILCFGQEHGIQSNVLERLMGQYTL